MTRNAAGVSRQSTRLIRPATSIAAPFGSGIVSGAARVSGPVDAPASGEYLRLDAPGEDRVRGLLRDEALQVPVPGRPLRLHDERGGIGGVAPTCLTATACRG
jgi:hypothetical protein